MSITDQPCAWCGAPTSRHTEVEPALMGTGRNKGRLIQPARHAPICQHCATRLQRSSEPMQRAVRHARSLHWRKRQASLFDL